MNKLAEKDKTYLIGSAPGKKDPLLSSEDFHKWFDWAKSTSFQCEELKPETLKEKFKSIVQNIRL